MFALLWQGICFLVVANESEGGEDADEDELMIL